MLRKNYISSLIGISLLIFGIWSCQEKQTNTTDADSTSSKLNLPKNSFGFFVIGDWGRNGEYNQKEVAQAMNEIATNVNPEFIISTGDNFYDNGVSSTNDSLWKTSFENIYTGSALQRNWFVVLGNHDYHGNPQAEIDYSRKSPRWSMPARYYTLKQKINDTTSIRFVFLDTSPFVEKYHEEKGQYSDLEKQDTLLQLKWLDSVLSNAKEQWKIVIGHHPIYSSSPKHGDTKELIAILKPRLEKYGVQVYLAGHEHDLQHQKPQGNIDYIVSGAGSETRPTGAYPFTKFAKDISGFATLNFTSDSLYLHFIDYQGRDIYSYRRAK